MLQKALFTSEDKPTDVVVGVEQSPYIVAFPWAPKGGFGVKYSDPSPALLSSGASGYWVDAAPNGRTLFTCGSTSSGGPVVTAVRWGGSGFGTAYSSPSISGSNYIQGVAMSPAGDAVIFVGGFNKIDAYAWTDASGFGTRYSNPATINETPEMVRFNNAGTAVGALKRSPTAGVSVFNAYPWSGSGFGTRYSDPATALGKECRSFRFSPSDDALVFGVKDGSTVNLIAYRWSGSGFGTRYTDASVSVQLDVSELVFSPDETKIIYSAFEPITGTKTSALAYQSWSSSSGVGGTVTFSSPATPRDGKSLAISPDGDAVAFAAEAAPRLSAYRWSSSGFGSSYSNPSTSLSSNPTNVIFVERS